MKLLPILMMRGLKNSLLFLNEKAQEHQIILFTCTKREKKILEEANIEYEWIEI